MGVIDSVVTDKYAIYNGDCIDVIRQLPDASVDYSVFSPPFSSLYTYSNSIRDMGNCGSDEEFFGHFGFLIDQLARVIKKGRNVSIHCMQIPTVKSRDGHIGLRDFRGGIIRAMEAAGFIYHAEVVVWKDPVTAMQRTKAYGLLHKTIRSNASYSRQGLPDYVLTFRNGEIENQEDKIAHDDMTVDEWQKLASPVWMDINQTRVLSHRDARDHEDERHICPLQLDVIERCVRLWTRTGDTVLTPFMGVGSEVYTAVKMGRKGIGVELKDSYYRQSVANLASLTNQTSLFND